MEQASGDILGFHHVAIIASDYQLSRHFYVDVLGFVVIAENFRAERNSWKCDLKIGEAQIELFPFRRRRLGYRAQKLAAYDTWLFVFRT